MLLAGLFIVSFTLLDAVLPSSEFSAKSPQENSEVNEDGIQPATDLVNSKYFMQISDYSSMPYYAGLYDKDTNTFYGSGVAISKYYVLIRGREGKEVESLITSKDILYIAAVDYSALTATDIPYTIKRIFYHPNYVQGQITHDLAVCQICEPININKYATFPPANIVYTLGTALDLLECNNNLRIAMGDNYIYPDSSCSATPLYDNTKHYCGKSGNIWIPNQYYLGLAPFALKNGVFYGFAVSTKDLSGLAAIQKIHLYTSWIAFYQ